MGAMNAVNPMSFPVSAAMPQRNSILSNPVAPTTTIQRRRSSILLGNERDIPVASSQNLGALNAVGQSPSFISPQQLYMTQLQAQIAQQQQAQLQHTVQQQQAMLLQMAMNQTSQAVGTKAVPQMMGMNATPTAAVTTQVKRARSSFALIEHHEAPFHSDDVADDEKADDVRHFKGFMGSLGWVQTPELWRGGIYCVDML